MDLVTPMAVRVAASLGLTDLMADDAVSVEELVLWPLSFGDGSTADRQFG